MNEIKNKFLRQSMFADGICQEGDSIWFISVKNNLLVRVNIESAEITDCRWIPTDSYVEMPYRYLISENNMLYILPYNDNSFCIYNIKKDKFERITIPQELNEGQKGFRFTGALYINRKIYMYGMNSIVVIYSIETKKFDVLDLNKYIPVERQKNENYQVDGCVNDNKIIFVVRNILGCILYDYDQKNGRFIAMPEESTTIIENVSVNKGGVLYSSRCEKEILKCYRFDSDEAYEILSAEKRDLVHKPFGYVHNFENKIFVLPGQNKKMYIVENDEKKEVDFLECEEFDRRLVVFPYEYAIRNACIAYNNHIFAIDAWNTSLIDIDMEKNSIKKTEMNFVEEFDWDKLCRQSISERNVEIWDEWHEGMLKAFIDEIVLKN